MNIKINGKEINTEPVKLQQLQDQYWPYKNNSMVMVNGFHVSEKIPLKEGDEIIIIEKGKMPKEDIYEAMMNARYTTEIYQKLKNANVAIAGLGGLGSNIAIALARTGVGHLHLVDFDIVEPSNLNRQQYSAKHLGMSKVDALKIELEGMNPYINIKIDREKVTENNIQQLFKDDVIICEAFDKPEAKALLVNHLLVNYPQKRVVSGSGMAGFESSNTIVTRKIRNNFYICGDEQSDAVEKRGLIASRVSICAGHQANMVLRLILGIEEV